jgi:hypothetical protein
MARIAVIFLVAVALAATVVIATTPQRDTVAYAVKRDGTGMSAPTTKLIIKKKSFFEAIYFIVV